MSPAIERDTVGAAIALVGVPDPLVGAAIPSGNMGSHILCVDSPVPLWGVQGWLRFPLGTSPVPLWGL